MWSEAAEDTKEDIEMEVDTEEVTKEIIEQTSNQQGGNNCTEQQGEKNHENQGQPQQTNGDQWDPSQVVCYKCFGTGHYSRGCAYRGRGSNPNCQGSGQRGGH